MSEEVDITALKKLLYDKLLEEQDDNTSAVWHQHEILELGVVKEVTILLAIANELVLEKLFKLVQEGGEVGWMLRTPAEAKAYRSLSLEQELVYSIIDEGGSDGAWTKTIKARSGLHEAVYKAAIKHLESKAMIQDMKSVEHPTRKMYIKSSVRQSDKSTGGPWFSNGELDEAFIEAMAGVMYQYILGKSFYRTSAPKVPKKIVSGNAGKKMMTSEEAKAARKEALGPLPSSSVENEPTAYELRQQHLQRFLPMPAGYAGYPDLQELTLHIENASYTDQTLSEAEVKQILDLLMYDDRIEAIPAGSTREGKDRFVYKVLRHSLVDEADKGTLANEVPCGRCPVFALCEEGGPVAPSNCEYFNEWLKI